MQTAIRREVRAHTRLIRHIYISVKSWDAAPDSLGPDGVAMQPCALWAKSDSGKKITKTGGTDVAKSQVSILPLHDSICGSNPAVVSVGNSCWLQTWNSSVYSSSHICGKPVKFNVCKNKPKLHKVPIFISLMKENPMGHLVPINALYCNCAVVRWNKVEACSSSSSLALVFTTMKCGYSVNSA